MDRAVSLNLGCGELHHADCINVDKYASCNPDLLWDLEEYPWPWSDNSVDRILASHVLEHMKDWERFVEECGRILKIGGILDVRVPHHTSTDALAYPDHYHVFHLWSWGGLIAGLKRTRNAWANEHYKCPFEMEQYFEVVKKEYHKWWLPLKLVHWMSRHLVNLMQEQIFILRRIPDGEV